MFNPFSFAEKISYEIYSSKNPKIDVTLDYISGWRYAEQKGAIGSFDQVIFYPPKGKEAGPSAAIVLTIEEAAENAANATGLEAFAQDLTQKRLQFTDAEVLAQTKTKVMRQEAREVTLKYKKLKELYSVNQDLVTVKEKLVIFLNGGKFYTLRYENTEKDFDKFSGAFKHIIGTLKIIDKTQ